MILALPLLLASCASLSEDACRSGDWAGIGVRDGMAGRGPSYVREHVDACGEYGIMPDLTLWEAGRQEGLKTYCTPRSAWEEGARGRILKDVCANAEALRDDNRRGLRYYRIGKEISRLERDIHQINDRIFSLSEGDPERVSLIRERTAIRLEIITLRTERMLYRY